MHSYLCTSVAYSQPTIEVRTVREQPGVLRITLDPQPSSDFTGALVSITEKDNPDAVIYHRQVRDGVSIFKNIIFLNPNIAVKWSM